MNLAYSSETNAVRLSRYPHAQPRSESNGACEFSRLVQAADPWWPHLPESYLSSCLKPLDPELLLQSSSKLAPCMLISCMAFHIVVVKNWKSYSFIVSLVFAGSTWITCMELLVVVVVGNITTEFSTEQTQVSPSCHIWIRSLRNRVELVEFRSRSQPLITLMISRRLD
jgi:hypothetical protein